MCVCVCVCIVCTLSYILFIIFRIIILYIMYDIILLSIRGNISSLNCIYSLILTTKCCIWKFVYSPVWPLFFFSCCQFGGNPVSCSIANAVLDVIEKESLQEHAKVLGDYWLKRLIDLKDDHPLIGDVRYILHTNFRNLLEFRRNSHLEDGNPKCHPPKFYAV